MNHSIEIYASTDMVLVAEHPEPGPPEYIEGDAVAEERIHNALYEDGEPKFKRVCGGQEVCFGLTDKFDNECLYGQYRFCDSTDTDKVVAEIVDNVLKDLEWYAIKYHYCDHDEVLSSGCMDSEIIERAGEVPTWIKEEL